MGESQGTLFQPEFNRSLRVEARPERLTSDSGVLLLRELMDRSGLSWLLREHLSDARDPGRVTHEFSELLRTALLLDAQGWHAHSEAGFLRADPALRLAVSSRRGDRPLRPARGREAEGLCSQATLSRLLQALSLDANREALGTVFLEWAAGRARAAGPHRDAEVTLDLDSVPCEVYGSQPGSAYNGHYGMRCYHPLVVRWDRGDFLGAALRPGNAHTAAGGLDFVLPMLRWARGQARRVWLRVDAGFPEPTLLDTLEAEGFHYVARLKTNAVLERMAAPLLRRPVGRPPVEGRTWLHELTYQAAKWSRPRRIVLVVLERGGEQGHLFLDHFFLLTDIAAAEVDAGALLERYRARGLAEKEFGDWKSSLSLALSSTSRPKSHYRGQRVRTQATAMDAFAANEARLLLSLLAANLLHAGAELLSADGRAQMSRARFRALVLKAAGRVLLSGRHITLVIGAAHATLWLRFCERLQQVYPARGSPHFQALPTPA